MAKEIERRWLITQPLQWYAKFKLHQCVKKEIVQTYLTEPPNCRLRRCEIEEIGMPLRIEHFITTKTTISPGENEEEEAKIMAHEYAWKLPCRDYTRHEIRKLRYEVKYRKQKFELDIFKDRLRGLVILELELKDIKDTVYLPPYIPVDREITIYPYYSNYSLSKLNSYSFGGF